MGYNTEYTLELWTSNGQYRIKKEKEEQIFNRLDQISEEIPQLSCNDGHYCGKWYEHNLEMVELSKEFPDILFDLYGEGENSYDMWHKYYLNGKVQNAPARVAFDPFDPIKLMRVVELR